MGRYVQRPSAVVIKPKGDNHEHAVLAGQNWPLPLSHRVVMAPLTRMRSDPGDIPSDLMVEYYSPARIEGWPDHFCHRGRGLRLHQAPRSPVLGAARARTARDP